VLPSQSVVLTFLMHGRTGAVALVGRAHFTLQMEEKKKQEITVGNKIMSNKSPE
jgi:hypothetical protein